ncbi:hypothetical protein Cgig2_025999 [Carnegiea gigantea]|uniref:Uncharacterized protein n=1 Tax=Carnegiea gigantea TaxID=171969 RepID=A0A9Q1K1V5_9CARY|nr:hypothetical protein Cgig2_025999 [Carnegiea gigantea]
MYTSIESTYAQALEHLLVKGKTDLPKIKPKTAVMRQALCSIQKKTQFIAYSYPTQKKSMNGNTQLLDNLPTLDTSHWKQCVRLLISFSAAGGSWLYCRHYFSNCILAFPNTPNYLASRVDLLEPGSLDYGHVPIYGYREGLSEGMTQAVRMKKNRDHAPLKDISMDFFGHNVYGHLTTLLNQGAMIDHTDYSDAENSPS